MRFSLRVGAYLALATTVATLITLGGAYQLIVTEQLEQANADAQAQRVLAKLEELAGNKRAMESATLSYVIAPSAQDLQRLRESEDQCRAYLRQLAQIVADNPEQRQRAASLEVATLALEALQQQVRLLRRREGVNASASFLASEDYRSSERKFEWLLETMRREENDRTVARHQVAAARTRQLGQLTLWSGLLTIGLALFGVAAIRRQRAERRLAEAHLREQEQQYRMVTGSIPAMIGYVDTRHRVLFHNSAVEKWLDLPAERIDQHHLSEVLGTDIYMSILPEVERALRGERAVCEHRRQSRDGRATYLVDTFTPDFDEAGRVRGFFALIIDITERKVAEHALRDSEARWRFALEGGGDGVWDRNIETGEVLYSRRYKEILGYADDEFPSRREEWERRLHPEDKARVMAELRAYLNGDSPAYSAEFRMRCKDGSWKWILSRGVVVSRDAEGKPLRMIGTHADISARVRQQEELTRANERLDLALQGSRLALWDADIAKGSIYLSEGWAEMLGDPPGATVTDAQALYALVHPDDREPIAAAFFGALKGTLPEYHIEHRVRTRAGDWKWILSHGQVVKRDAAGRALRMTGTNADISARKEIERMKNEFIAVVSHELRTPLSSIVGSLGLLDRIADLSAETKTLVRVARENSQRLVRLISDILDVEKLDSDALKIQLEPVELEAMLANAILANQGYGAQYGISITLTESPGPAWVNANYDRLMQVMANLLSNAAKFAPRGSRVEVRLQRSPGAFRVSVIDSGPGIPDEFKPRVFDRFAQADSSASRRTGGTGLGLAISRMIIDKLGGKIDFVSTPGLGTRFFFDLPYDQLSTRQDEPEHGAMRI